MTNLLIVILRHLVTQDQREKMQMMFGIRTTRLSSMSLRMSIFSLDAIEMCLLLSLTPFLPPKLRTYPQRELPLQREPPLQGELVLVKAND